MTIIVEDGTVVVNANSYVTAQEVSDYAHARGVGVSDSPRVLEQQITLAMDYLESLRSAYQGKKSSLTQALQWPRSCVYIDGELFPYNAIPTELKAAQCQLVVDINAGLDPLANADGTPYIISERVDVIETKYSEAIATSGLPLLRKVEALLEPLLSGDGILTSVRV